MNLDYSLILVLLFIPLMWVASLYFSYWAKDQLEKGNFKAASILIVISIPALIITALSVALFFSGSSVLMGMSIISVVITVLSVVHIFFGLGVPMVILIVAVVITVLSVILFINNKDDEYVSLAKVPALLAVTIDIDPKIIDSNKINIERTRIIKVAVLTDAEFDAPVQINPWTTLLDNDEADNYSVRDVDKDGDSDLLLTFTAKNVGFTCDTTELTLTGETYDGVGIQGTDSVSITGCK